jgi:hypothetical protein
MVATLKKPWMNEGGAGEHGSRCAFLVRFWAVKKNTGLSEIAFINYKNLFIKSMVFY